MGPRELELAQQIKEDTRAPRPRRSPAPGRGRDGSQPPRYRPQQHWRVTGRLEHFLSDAAIRKSLVEKYLQDNSLRRQQQVALNFVSRAYLEQGDLATAYSLCARCRGRDGGVRGRRLAQPRLATRPWTLPGDLCGLFAVAGRPASRGSVIRQLVGDSSPDAQGQAANVARQRDLASTAISAGWLSLRRGDAVAATSYAEEAERALAAQVSKGTDRISARIVAESRLLAAEAVSRRGLAIVRERFARRHWPWCQPMCRAPSKNAPGDGGPGTTGARQGGGRQSDRRAADSPQISPPGIRDGAGREGDHRTSLMCQQRHPFSPLFHPTGNTFRPSRHIPIHGGLVMKRVSALTMIMLVVLAVGCPRRRPRRPPRSRRRPTSR